MNSIYNVQCFVGHVFNPEKGSELEQRCIQREQDEGMDALCVSHDECPECQEDKRESARKAADYCSMHGCFMGGFGEPCRGRCHGTIETKVLCIGGVRAEVRLPII